LAADPSLPGRSLWYVRGHEDQKSLMLLVRVL